MRRFRRRRRLLFSPISHYTGAKREAVCHSTFDRHITPSYRPFRGPIDQKKITLRSVKHPSQFGNVPPTPAAASQRPPAAVDAPDNNKSGPKTGPTLKSEASFVLGTV